MALFNKFFPNRKRAPKPVSGDISSKPFSFSKDQVRILLYRECEWRGRRLLFDSSAVQRVHLSDGSTTKRDSRSAGKSTGFVEICDGFGYRYTRPNTDSGCIGEMVFGAVAMSFRGTALKVHWLTGPSRMLCAQVFMSPVSTQTIRSRVNSSSIGESCYSSMDGCSLSSMCDTVSVCVPAGLQTTPLDVPNVGHSESYSGGDSGYYGTSCQNDNFSQNYGNDVSFTQSYSTRSSLNSTVSDKDVSARKLSDLSGYSSSMHHIDHASSQNSLHRRFLKNLSTSFEQDWYGHDSAETDGRRPVTDEPGRRAKLGLAVCVTLTDNMESEMQYFYLEHIPLIESMLNRLRLTVEHAYITKPSFLSVMIDGCEKTAQWLTDLFSGPRISNPIWSGLVNERFNQDNDGTARSDKHSLANGFMEQLYKLLTLFDTKSTNFFISTLLTAVLTHHLGWVTTVIPTENNQNSESKSVLNNIVDFRMEEYSSVIKDNKQTNANNSVINNLNELNSNFPYNALWAQLSDLYGANGYPTKLSKTIVCGLDTKVVGSILNILTYFIRCGEVKRVFHEKIHETDVLNRLLNNDDLILEDNNVKTDIPLNEDTCDYIEMKTFKSNLDEILVSHNNCNKTGVYISDLTKSDKIVDRCKLMRTDSDTNKKTIVTNNLNLSDSNLYCSSRQTNLNSNESLVMSETVTNNGETNDLSFYCSSSDSKEKNSSNSIIDFNFCPIEIHEKVSKLCRVPASAIEYHLDLQSASNETNKSIDRQLSNCSNQSDKTLIGTPPCRNTFSDNISPSTCLSSSAVNMSILESSTSDLVNADGRIVLGNQLHINLQSNQNNSLLKIDNEKQMKAITDNQKDNKPLGGLGRKTKCSYSNLSILLAEGSIGISDKTVVSKDYSAGRLDIGEEERNNVIFVLGENEELVGLKSSKRKAEVEVTEKEIDCSGVRSLVSNININNAEYILDEKENPSKSCDANNGAITKKLLCQQTSECQHKHKKHSGVKFNFEQYPQIATNYMRSKNLEYSNHQFVEKGIKMEQEHQFLRDIGASTSFVEEETQCDCCKGSYSQSQILQTPCNASELEFTSDLIQNTIQVEFADVKITPPEEKPTTNVVRKKLDNTSIQNNDLIFNFQSPCETLSKPDCTKTENAVVAASPVFKDFEDCTINLVSEGPKMKTDIQEVKQFKEMKIIHIPMPKSRPKLKPNLKLVEPGFPPSLLGGITDHYIADMALQGTLATPDKFEQALRRDLALSTHSQALLDTDISESICIVADCDKWEVRVVSSQTYVLSHHNSEGQSGHTVGMSQLVSNMLEVVLYMWKMKTPAEHCLLYLENKLRELYHRSQSLASLLLNTDFCQLPQVTESLGVEVNDVPLLLSIASTHSPQVTSKYGLSFR